MSDDEKALLVALAWMAEQYLRVGDQLDSLAMSAGEGAIRMLARYGLVKADPIGRTAVWTDAGLSLLDAK